MCRGAISSLSVIAGTVIAMTMLAGCTAIGSGPGATAPPASGSASGVDPEVAPAGFTLLSDVDPTIQHEIRYFGDYNFVGRPIEGYEAPACILTTRAAEALREVQSDLREVGLALKVYDCYRPQRAVDEFAEWAEDPSATRMQAEFYPEVPKDRLFTDGYIARESGHSRGSTVDLTLVELGEFSAGEPPATTAACGVQPGVAPAGDELDMGTGFDCFDPLSNTESTAVDPAAQANRRILVDAMAAHGFVNLPEEWWHFRFEPEPYPDDAFDFPVDESVGEPSVAR